MSKRNGTHTFGEWAKERLDKMNATLASLESSAGKLRGEAHDKAESNLAGLREQRDHFKQILEKDGEARKEAQAHTKATLEARWSAFQARVHHTSTPEDSSTPGQR